MKQGKNTYFVVFLFWGLSLLYFYAASQKPYHQTLIPSSAQLHVTASNYQQISPTLADVTAEANEEVDEDENSSTCPTDFNLLLGGTTNDLLRILPYFADWDKGKLFLHYHRWKIACE